MRTIVCFLCAYLLAFSAAADTLQCEVSDGAYKSPGSTSLVDALMRDPTLSGNVFHVNRETGEIVGSSLLRNEGKKITILRNIDEIINVVEIMSVNDHFDLTFLAVKEFEGKLTFSYYIGFFGLMLIGECRNLG